MVTLAVVRPAGGWPKLRASARPIKAKAVISPELPVFGPISTATGARGAVAAAGAGNACTGMLAMVSPRHVQAYRRPSGSRNPPHGGGPSRAASPLSIGH